MYEQLISDFTPSSCCSHIRRCLFLSFAVFSRLPGINEATSNARRKERERERKIRRRTGGRAREREEYETLLDVSFYPYNNGLLMAAEQNSDNG